MGVGDITTHFCDIDFHQLGVELEGIWVDPEGGFPGILSLLCNGATVDGQVLEVDQGLHVQLLDLPELPGLP